MLIRAPRNAAQEETRRHHGVPREGERFLDGYYGQVEEVGEHMEAEEHGRCVGRDEVGEEVRDGVIIVRREGERGAQ